MCNIALALAAAVLAQGRAETIRWLSDFKQAQFEAKQSGKPIFVVFR